MIPRFLRVFCTLWWFLESRIMALAHPSRHDHARCRALRDFSVLARTSNRELFARHTQPFCSLRATSGHFEFCAPHKASSSGLAALIGTSPFPRRPHQNSFTFTTSHALLHRMRKNRIQPNSQYSTHIGWNSFLRAPFYPVNLTV